MQCYDRDRVLQQCKQKVLTILSMLSPGECTGEGEGICPPPPPNPLIFPDEKTPWFYILDSIAPYPLPTTGVDPSLMLRKITRIPAPCKDRLAGPESRTPGLEREILPLNRRFSTR